jgi:hypothetical protein
VIREASARTGKVFDAIVEHIRAHGLVLDGVIMENVLGLQDRPRGIDHPLPIIAFEIKHAHCIGLSGRVSNFKLAMQGNLGIRKGTGTGR